MSTTAIIHDTIWTGRMARELRKLETRLTPRDLMFYLLTGPEKNAYGLFMLELEILGRRLAGTEADFFAAMQVLIDQGFCQFDPPTGWVWVVEMAHYQFQAPLKFADYRCKSIRKWYRTAPRNVFMGPWFDRYEKDFHLSVGEEAVERRHYAPFSQPVSNAPVQAPPNAPGGKPLSTYVRTSEFDLVAPEVQEPRSLLPVDPETRRLSTPEAEAAFEELWPSYPNGKQKKDAKELFLKLKPTPAFVRMLAESIRAHKTSHEWTKQGGTFVPRMVNWLKREGWNDRVDAPAPVVNERTSATMRAAQAFASRTAGPDEGEP